MIAEVCGSVYALGMMKPAPEDRERLELAADLLEQYLTSYVETGLIEVGDRAIEEILDEISRNISEDVEYQDFEVRPVFDHRDSLLDRAGIGGI